VNIIDRIKGPKSLTFDHWRYRILHWSFGKEQGQRSDDLPKYLYTHYCPLFHFTNFLAVFSGFIALWKILKFILLSVLESISDGIDNIKSSKTFTVEEKTPTEQEEHNLFFKLLRAQDYRLASAPTNYEDSWDTFWIVNYSKFKVLNTNSTKTLFMEHWPAVAEDLDKHDKMLVARKEKIDKIVAVSNFTCKSFLSILYYVALALLVIVAFYALYNLCMFLAFVVKSIFANPALMARMIVITFAISFAVAVGFLVISSKVFHGGRENRLFKPVFVGASLFDKHIAQNVGYAIGAIGEFCSTFYEENCPMIMLPPELEVEDQKDPQLEKIENLLEDVKRSAQETTLEEMILEDTNIDLSSEIGDDDRAIFIDEENLTLEKNPEGDEDGTE